MSQPSPIFRLTAVYGVVVFFFSTVFKHFDFGPLNSVEADTEICAESYWKNLFYITNIENVGSTSGLEAVSKQNEILIILK